MSKTTLGYIVTREKEGKEEYIHMVLNRKNGRMAWEQDIDRACKFKNEQEAEEAMNVWKMVPGMHNLKVKELCLQDVNIQEKDD